MQNSSLMVVEQHSLCWLTGRLADNLQQYPGPEDSCGFADSAAGIRDGEAPAWPRGWPTGAVRNARCPGPRRTRRSGRPFPPRGARARASRQRQQTGLPPHRRSRGHHRERRKRGGREADKAPLAAYGGGPNAAARPWRPGRPRKAWAPITDALRSTHTETGELNTRASGRGDHRDRRCRRWPIRSGPRRGGHAPPQLLAFLDRTLTNNWRRCRSAAVREAAVQAEGLRQRPEGWQGRRSVGGDVAGRAVRVTSPVLALAGAEGAEAVVRRERCFVTSHRGRAAWWNA